MRGEPGFDAGPTLAKSTNPVGSATKTGGSSNDRGAGLRIDLWFAQWGQSVYMLPNSKRRQTDA